MTAPDSRPSVLVVDDVPGNIRLLGHALRPECRVLFATSGAEALVRAAAEPRPDLVLLDVVMPGLDGYEVCRRLKAEDTTRDIPVIFVSAATEVEDETRGLGCGAVDYIARPFGLAIVRARVRTHLDLKRHRDRTAALSAEDGLTGVGNRRRFDEVLKREWTRAGRSGTSLALVMLDIDHFKAFNDTHGHLAGDECIRQVAQAMARCGRRAADVVTRYGGEEFVAILPDTDTYGALTVAESMRCAVEALAIPHGASETGTHVTASLGVAAGRPTDGGVPDDLVERADQAMYRAKRAGRNRVISEDPAPRGAPLANGLPQEFFALPDLVRPSDPLR